MEYELGQKLDVIIQLLAELNSKIVPLEKEQVKQ